MELLATSNWFIDLLIHNPAVVVLTFIATNPGRWFLSVATLGPMTWKKSPLIMSCSYCYNLCFFCRFPSISQDYTIKRQRQGLQFLPSVRFCELLGGFFVDTAHLYCSGITTSCTKYAPKNVPWPVRLRICNEKLFGDGNHFLGLKHHV